MANEEMKVICSLSNKGGVGKTMMIKVFGSAALANDYRVLFIDTDGNNSLSDWAERAQESGNWPENGRIVQSEDVAEVENLIDQAYEDETFDLIFIDTAGYGTSELDRIAVLSDFVLTPLKISETDLKATLKARDWFEGLSSRVEGDDDLPEQVFIINDVGAPLNAQERELIPRIREEFNTTKSMMPKRAAFATMDKQGPLMTLVHNIQESENSSLKVQIRHIYKALEIGTGILNEVITGDRHGS